MFHNYKYGSQFSTLKNAAFNDRTASLFQIPDSGVGGGGRGAGWGLEACGKKNARNPRGG